MPPLLLPILAQALSLNLGDATEVRLRSDQTGQHIDFATTGRVELDLKLRRTTWMLYYSPVLTELGVGSSTPTQYLMHTGGLTARLRLTPRTALIASENGAYGQQNFHTLAVSAQQPAAGNQMGNPAAGGAQPNAGGAGTAQPGGAPGQAASPALAVAGDRTIRFGSLTTTVGLEHALGHTWIIGGLAGYTVFGELDSYVPVTIPRSRTILGNVWISHAFSPRDQWVLTNTGKQIATEPSAEALVITTNIAWNHRLSLRSSTSVFVNESYIDSTDVTGRHANGVVPGAGASLMWTEAIRPPGTRLATTITAMVAPLIDYQTGGVNNMASGLVATRWMRKRLAFEVLGNASYSLSNYGPVNLLSIYGLSEAVIYQLDRRHFTVSAGSRQALQRFANGQQVPMFWVAFIGLTYTTGALPL